MSNPDAAAVGRLVAWVFGLAPALLFVVTWSEQHNVVQLWLRAMAGPVVVAEAAVIFVSFREGFQLAAPKRFLLALVAMLGAIVWATAAIGPFPIVGLLRAGTWTVHLFFALAIVNLWHNRMLDFDQHRIAQLSGFVLVFCLLVAFVATTEQSDLERINGLPAFSNVRWFGYYASAAIGLSALGFLRRDGLSLLAAIIGFALAFWTASRGSVAAVVGALILCTILFDEFRSGRAWLLFLLSGLAGFVIALALDALVPIAGLGPYNLARLGWSGRIEMWQDTWTMVLERPLFGHGDGQFRYVVDVTTFGQPHSVVLQVLHAWGVVGGLLCLALAVWFAPRFLKATGWATAPFRFAALAIAAQSLVDGSLYYIHSTSLFALCCAMAVAAGLPKAVRDTP